MESSSDKQWAAKYLLDPLTAPEPSDETGPGTHHVARGPSTTSRKPVASASVSSSASEKTVAQDSYPTPPASSRSERFPDFDGVHANPKRFSSTTTSSHVATSTTGGGGSTISEGCEGNKGTRPRRTSSLQQRHPGDPTHRPLDMLRRSEKKAQRSPHLRKSHHVGADSIDSLDAITGSAYHHEGPYDAALLARNSGRKKDSPVAAVARGNAEALRATPREKVLDSLQRHIPLDGTANVPSGMMDREGRWFRYEEGTDMMREGNPEGGAYRRWPGVQYLPEDLKGKGEPSYTIEKALKTHKRNVSESNKGSYEMVSSPTTPSRAPRRGTTQGDGRPNAAAQASGRDGLASQRPYKHHRASSTGTVSAHRVPAGAESYVDWERGGSVKQSESGAGGRLRKRFGSLRVKE